MRLSSKDQDNIINLIPKKKKEKKPRVFSVNFFIDGKWNIIKVKDSFPIFEIDKDDSEFVGVTPNNNELFLMILEKAWAQINGGYDKIEGGNIENIFELLLGCKCDYFLNDNSDNYIDSLYTLMKENEKFFWTFNSLWWTML